MSLGGQGVRDWLTQRITAVYLVIYLAVLLWFCCGSVEMSYTTWKTFMLSPWMKVMTLLALLSVSLHAWVGVWTVLTDYVHQVLLRQLIQMAVIISLVGFFLWGFQILYGVS